MMISIHHSLTVPFTLSTELNSFMTINQLLNMDKIPRTRINIASLALSLGDGLYIMRDAS